MFISAGNKAQNSETKSLKCSAW